MMNSRMIWRALRARYRDQKTELDLIQKNIGPVVCDIGANKGSYLFWMARWAQKVIAFEPQENLAAYLKDSFRSRPNVTVEAKGVFSESGERALYIPPGSPASASIVHAEGEKVMIPVVALDQYFQPETRVSLLKIDVEGAELDVFRGAERVLSESAPALLFECEVRHCNHSIFDVFTHLERRGYRGQFISDGNLLPVSEFDPARHQRQGAGSYWNAPDYCNNFLFRVGRDAS